MKYQSIDMGSFQVHFIPTDRFKTITIRVSLRDEIQKEEITYRNLLTDVLTYSTEKFPSRRELILREQELYGANVHTTCYRSGRYTALNFFLSILNEKYTEEGMLEASIEFFSDLMFRPNVSQGKFVSEAFTISKKNLSSSIRSIKEDMAQYSMIRLLESMDDGSMPYAYREYGDVEVLDSITEESLYQYYKKVMNQSLVDVYILGDYDVETMKQLVKQYFLFDTFKRPKINPIIEHDQLPSKVKTIIEPEEVGQSKLSIGCKIGSMSEFERNYVLTIYNLILGGGGDSKFFNNIREKHSLAYYVKSSVNKLDHLLLIKAGISKENFKETVKLIKKEMKDMQKGIFTEEDMEKAKSTYRTFLKEIEDSPGAIIETYLAKDLLNIGDIEERREMVQEVTKEQIVQVANKVEMDTIFLIEGTIEHEGN